jgi:hypothetical protein
MRNPVVAEELEDARGTSCVELGERIIEQDEWSTAHATKSSGLEQTKRNRCGPLLTRRSECAKRMASEHELEIIAVRTGVRDSAPQIVGALRFERSSQNTDELWHRHTGPHAPREHRCGRVSHVCIAALADRGTQPLKIIRYALDPRDASGPQDSAVLRESRFPHRGASDAASDPFARRVAKRRIPSYERRTVLLQRTEIPARRQRERDVEKPPSRTRASSDELHISRRKHHRGKRTKRVAQARRFDAIDRDALALACALKRRGQRPRSYHRRFGQNVKAGRPESHHVLIARAARRPEQLQVVDRFEEIRFPVPVVADDREALRRNLELQAFEVPEIAKCERAKLHRADGLIDLGIGQQGAHSR